MWEYWNKVVVVVLQIEEEAICQYYRIALANQFFSLLSVIQPIFIFFCHHFICKCREDHRSSRHNLSSCTKKVWKITLHGRHKKGRKGEGEKSPKGQRERDRMPTNSPSNLITLTVNKWPITSRGDFQHGQNVNEELSRSDAFFKQ